MKIEQASAAQTMFHQGRETTGTTAEHSLNGKRCAFHPLPSSQKAPHQSPSEWAGLSCIHTFDSEKCSGLAISLAVGQTETCDNAPPGVGVER